MIRVPSADREGPLLDRNMSFTFTAIAVENLAGSTSTTDDVTGGWPP
jgi:hypothetical protein